MPKHTTKTVPTQVDSTTEVPFQREGGGGGNNDGFSARQIQNPCATLSHTGSASCETPLGQSPITYNKNIRKRKSASCVTPSEKLSITYNRNIRKQKQHSDTNKEVIELNSFDEDKDDDVQVSLDVTMPNLLTGSSTMNAAVENLR